MPRVAVLRLQAGSSNVESRRDSTESGKPCGAGANDSHRAGTAPATDDAPMIVDGSFEHILAALHKAALDPADWSGAAGLIDEALGTHGSTLACGDGETDEDFRLYLMWTCLRGLRRRDLERLWMGTYLPVDEGVPRLRRLPSTG